MDSQHIRCIDAKVLFSARIKIPKNPNDPIDSLEVQVYGKLSLLATNETLEIFPINSYYDGSTNKSEPLNLNLKMSQQLLSPRDFILLSPRDFVANLLKEKIYV